MSLFVLSLLAVMQLSPGAVVKGVAVRAGTTEPVAGARILLTKIDGKLNDSIATRADDRGRFSIANVPAGRYRIFADRDDFVRAEGQPIAVEATQTPRDLQLSMTPSGVITGRVVDQFNDPVAKVYVRAVKNERAFEAPTNDLGDFRIFGLPPGSYLVSAAPYLAPRIQDGRYIVPTPPAPDSPGEGQGMMQLAGLLRTGDFIHPMALSAEPYARVFYPGTTDQSAARPVDVQPGAIVSSINFRTLVTR
jgi:hypothetical protein